MELKFLKKEFIIEQEQNNDFCRTYLFEIQDILRIRKLLYVHINAGYLHSNREDLILKEVETDIESYWLGIKKFEGTLGLYISRGKSEFMYSEWFKKTKPKKIN